MPLIMPTRDNTCAVVVTYHPDDDFHNRLKHVADQFSSIIIVDNGSAQSAVEMLRAISKTKSIILLENRDNLGVAAALNQGAKLALREGYQWIVTLDQDSVLHSDFLDSLVEIFRKSGEVDILVGSNYWDVHRNRAFIRCDNNGDIFKERKTLITSGALIPISLFSKIGYFREDYFIDSVDHEFCLRARDYGFRMLISCRPIITHSIGGNIEHSGLLRRLSSFSHSPKRKYYISRNTIVTAKSYFRRETLWSLRQGWRLLFDLASIILFESNKGSKLSAFIVGMAHGFIGKMGPIEKTWPNRPR